MVVDDWVEDCNLIPMFPTVIKKTRHTEEKAGQGTMKGMTLGSRLGRLERQFQNSCLNCQWGVIGAISYKKAEERREGKRQKQGQMNSSRLLKWESIVCGSLLGRRHCDDSIFISRENDCSVGFKIQWVLVLQTLPVFLFIWGSLKEKVAKWHL